MKQQVIYLEPHDDILSARDKLSWTRADQVLVVLPEAEPMWAFRNKVGIVLLQREAGRLHIQIALVSSDPVVRDHCYSLNVPCFTTIERSQKTVWDTSPPSDTQIKAADQGHVISDWSAQQTMRQTTLPANIPRVPLRTILAFGSLIILIPLLVFGPAATVTVRPRNFSAGYSVEITSDPNLVEVDVDSATIPGRSIVMEVGASASVDATGIVDLPISKASGQVSITNQLSDQIVIPAGTVFVSATSQPVRFRSLSASTLPGRVGETITIDIEAVDPGKAGNLERNHITGIEGNLANGVTVTNLESTRGGRSVRSIAISNEDRVRVRSLVIQQMFQKAQTSIQENLDIGLLPSEFVPIETLQFALVRSEDYSGEVGEQATSVTLQMQAVIQGIAIDERSARQVAYQHLISSGSGITAVESSSLEFSMGPVTHIDSHRRVTFSIEALTARPSAFDPKILQGLITGMTVEQAKANLASNFSSVAEYTLEVWPPFWPFTPLMGERISVKIDDEP